MFNLLTFGLDVCFVCVEWEFLLNWFLNIIDCVAFWRCIWKRWKKQYKGYNCAEVSFSQCKVLRENSEMPQSMKIAEEKDSTFEIIHIDKYYRGLKDANHNQKRKKKLSSFSFPFFFFFFFNFHLCHCTQPNILNLQWKTNST